MGTPLDTPPYRDLIALATRAPSVHNTQPWHWCIAGRRLILFADTSRQLRYADPDGRDLVLSCGAALHHLRVAAEATGWTPFVRRMPNPYNDHQLANISFQPSEPSAASLAKLDALLARRTDRRTPTSWPVPRERLDRLLALGPASGVTVAAVVSAAARAALLAILAEAEKAQRLKPRFVDEAVQWTGRTDAQGIPVSSLLRRGQPAHSALPPTRFPSGTLTDHPAEPDQVQPALLAICSSSDDVGSQLRAGEALGAILLEGTAQGLSMVPLSQAIELDRTRTLLQHQLLRDSACPQILVQVGWAHADNEQIPPTPRLPVDDVLGTIAALPPWIGPYHA